MEKINKERELKLKPPFLVFPDISLLFPRALKYDKHSLLLQAETCGETQDEQRFY